MGKIPDGILGPVIGKIGPVVGYVLNGQYIVRALPKPRSGEKTIKEKSNTSKFAKVQAWMSPLSEFVGLGFKGYGTKTGGYKAAVSYALQHAVVGEYPDQAINPELVRVSGGDLFFPLFAEAVLQENHQLKFTWNTGKGPNGHEYDQAMLLAYSPDDEDARTVYILTGEFRMRGTDVLQLHPDVKDREYYVYLGFVSQHRSGQSHSKYLGKVLVLSL